MSNEPSPIEWILWQIQKIYLFMQGLNKDIYVQKNRDYTRNYKISIRKKGKRKKGIS